MNPSMAAEVRMGELTADFGKTAADYGKHRAGFPPKLFDRLAAIGIIRAGMRTLDLGTGTGTIARSLAQRGCESIGLDRSAPLMQEARRIDREGGVTVRYIEAVAEDTGFPEASFDLVLAGQCWFWFDRPRAALEARRIMKPGGHLVIAFFDWIPLPANVAEQTEKLIERHNPKWKLGGGIGMHPRCLADMASAGFRSLETFSFDLDVPLLARGVARPHSRQRRRRRESLAGSRGGVRSRPAGPARRKISSRAARCATSRFRRDRTGAELRTPNSRRL